MTASMDIPTSSREALLAELLGQLGVIEKKITALKGSTESLSSGLEVRTGELIRAANTLNESADQILKKVDSAVIKRAALASSEFTQNVSKHTKEAIEGAAVSGIADSVSALKASVNGITVAIANIEKKTVAMSKVSIELEARAAKIGKATVIGWAKIISALFVLMIGSSFLAASIATSRQSENLPVSAEVAKNAMWGRALASVFKDLPKATQDQIRSEYAKLYSSK